MDDYVMIIQDGCIKIIKFEDFISGISLGGFSVCQAWLNCVCGIGLFTTDDTPPDTPPTMQDLYVSLENRQQNRAFTSDEFLDKYYDAEGDEFGKIIITGGDVSGYTLNGNIIHIGMVIPANQLMDLEYDSKNQDASYTQDLFFEAYDINNVKAQSI
jgi:hypothetical protein